MVALLLAVIYLSFISLGLPDSLLGSGWPVMHMDLGVPLSYAGIISMVIAGGTIASSLLSARVTRRFGTGLVTAVSIGLTAMGLIGFSLFKNFYLLCLCAIPYGLGAGAIDAALNNYVALHFSARHMSWLHAFWGVGVSISPYIMGWCLSHQLGWQMGYRTVSIIQIVLTALVFLSLPLWNRRKEEGEEVVPRVLTVRQSLQIPGVPYVLLAFLGLCAVEATAGLWASSYLVEYRGVNPETAARFAALFYLGETGGRFLNGYTAERFGDKIMIRVGGWVMVAGTLMIMLPLKSDALALAGLVVLGLGVAPVYPCIIHSTPGNFGRVNSQALVGIQMASAYVGTTFMPPLFGLIAEHISAGLYPAYLLLFAVLLLMMTELLNRTLRRK